MEFKSSSLININDKIFSVSIYQLAMKVRQHLQIIVRKANIAKNKKKKKKTTTPQTF